jgi:hypothetical protein
MRNLLKKRDGPENPAYKLIRLFSMSYEPPHEYFTLKSHRNQNLYLPPLRAGSWRR